MDPTQPNLTGLARHLVETHGISLERLSKIPSWNLQTFHNTIHGWRSEPPFLVKISQMETDTQTVSIDDPGSTGTP